MTSVDDWYLYGHSLAACLVAVVPEVASTMFELVQSPQALRTSTTAQWYRLFKGYVHLGGGDYHYQRDPPAGVAPSEIRDAGVMPSDRLMRELDHFLTDVRAASAGHPVPMRTRDGQQVMFQASKNDLARLHERAETLARTRDACQPGYNRAVTKQTHMAILERVSAQRTSCGAVQAIVDSVCAGAADVLNLRQHYAADARLTAWFLVLSRLCAELALQHLNSGRLGEFEVVRLAYMAIEGSSMAHDPEQMLAQMARDFSRAGLGDLVLNLCDEAFSTGERERDEAQEAADLEAHARHLYSGACFAFAAMRLAEVFHECVAPSARPIEATDKLLKNRLIRDSRRLYRNGFSGGTIRRRGHLAGTL